MVIQALLGLCADAPNAVLRVVNPHLPDWLDTVRIRNLRVGSGTVSLTYRRHGHETDIDVDHVQGRTKVVLSRNWPRIRAD
jgi:hypothetical protein